MKRTLYISSFIVLMSVGLVSFRSFSILQEQFLQFLEEKLEAYNEALPGEKIYLQIDKPFYKPGEDIWLNAFVVNGTTHTPTLVSDIAYVELINPKGSVEKRITLPVRNGSSAGDFALDASLPGGLYKLRAYTQWMKNFGEDTFFEKDIQVQKVITPRVLLKLDFEKEAYGPSDKVEAKLEIKNLRNESISGQEVKIYIQLAGVEYLQQTSTTNREGMSILQFNLPLNLQTSDGLVTALVEYEGKTESISRSIPIVLNKIDLQFFPEGGQLVENVPGKVAFKALNEFGKPADVTGVILDEKGKAVGQFQSFHQGMGAFTFKAKPNEKYIARITKPEGVASSYPLPIALPKGYALAIDTLTKDMLQLSYYAPVAKEVYLVAQIRGKIYYSQKLSSRIGKNLVDVPLKGFPIGIAQITLFDNNQVARCERLVFVNAYKQLNVQISTDKAQYAPREKVELTIKTTDEDSLPIPANLSIAVVDDKLLSFADDKQDNILSHLLMSSDLKGDIEEPSFYFNPEETKAKAALDFVLLTHGWRRFTWQEVLEKEAKITYYPEKTGTIAGTVYNTKTSKPQTATVTLFELGNRKRASRVKTNPDGSFVFLDVDSTTPIQIFAEAAFIKNGNISIKLDNNVAQSYGIVQKDKGAMEELVVLDSEIIQEELVEVPNEEEIEESVGQHPVQAISNQNVSLTADVQALSEVVVVGYGTHTKRDITGSVVVVQAEDVPGLPHLSPEQAIQGRAAGIQITSNASMPGEGAKVRMYGARSFTADEPLYVIDGYPVEILVNDNFSAMGFISADNIRNIEVIKSPGATTLYGSRAMHGVIVITTKKGDYRPRQLNSSQKSLSGLLIQPRSFANVREFYTPLYKSTVPTHSRTDFRSTIYWHPSLQTNNNGTATVSFFNSDEVTTFRAVAEGISANGLAGRGEHTYFTQLPLSMDAKIPPYLMFEDRVDIPLFLKNTTASTVEGKLTVSLPKSIKLVHPLDSFVTLAPHEARSVYIACLVLPISGKDTLTIEFAGSHYRDVLEQEIEIMPKGFPTQVSFSDKSLQNSFSFHINEPMKGSIKAHLKAYPDILTDLVSGIESILQEPYGCFEQTSSSTYPNILALQYLKETGTASGEVERRALAYIQNGYKRLIAFETKEYGFEWFGHTPPHEGLTAFGLMEFLEMQQVYSGVSKNMIERTKQWLLSRKDGKGGFKQNKGKYGFAAASREVNNAYLVYALSQAGINEINKEYELAYAEAKQSKDAYRMALVALASFNLNQEARGKEIMDKLIAEVNQKGLDNLQLSQSIVSSYGKSLAVETASLFALALLRSKEPAIEHLQKTINYIIGNRAYGGFGSTQATILSLKALTEYAKFSKQTAESGELVLFHNNSLIRSAHYEKGARGEIVIDGIEKYLQSGKQDFKILFAHTKEPLPYSLNVSWNSYTPNLSTACQVDLQTSLSATQTQTGRTVRLSTTLRNKSTDGLPMTVTLIGIPSGLSPQPWQLKELQEKGKVDFYEVRQNYVVFYFRELAPKALHEIHLDLKAEVPGSYQAPASSAYVYYTNERKDWEAGEKIEINK